MIKQKIGTFLSWFFGSIFILSGLGNLSENAGLAFFLVLAGALLLPPVMPRISKLTNIALSGWKKIVIVSTILFIGGIVASPEENTEREAITSAREAVQEADHLLLEGKKEAASEVLSEAEEEVIAQALESDTETTKEEAEFILKDSQAVESTDTFKTNNPADIFTFMNARVSKVIDGDTIDITDVSGATERVRIIGIDTPETKDPRKPVQCFGKEASAKAYKLLFNQHVSLSVPKDNPRDKYNRLLAYVQVGEEAEDYGGLMIGLGYAFHYRSFPHVAYEIYDSLEELARDNEMGLWSPETCNGVASPVEEKETDTTQVSAPVAAPVQQYTEPVASPIIEPEPVVSDYACSCSGNTKNCSDFLSHSEAQAYYECCMQQVGYDVHKLDRDKNGLACESL